MTRSSTSATSCAALGEREVPARLIGELVMDELHHLDEVAYVRFASVYRSFQDVDAFREEIEKLRQRRRAGRGTAAGPVDRRRRTASAAARGSAGQEVDRACLHRPSPRPSTRTWRGRCELAAPGPVFDATESRASAA